MAGKEAPKGRPVLVTTAHRGVFFGYEEWRSGNTIVLTQCRNCIYWPAKNRGFLGLAADGPLEGARVGRPSDRTELFDVTSVSDVCPEAVARWEAFPWQS